MSNQQLPPGYSADDITTAPNTKPVSQQSSQGLPPGYSPDDIVSKPGMGMNPSGPAPQNDEVKTDPNADFADKAVHAVAGTFEGIGEGLFGTAAGVGDLLGAKGTGVSDALHKLAGDNNTTHGTAQNVGRGIETIGEFILGDEALKGLSFADKLKHTSAVMKLLEKTPKLSKALQLGINIGKAGTELSPEERALLKQSPTIARLVGLGMDSVRAGVVQGAQTGIHTGDLGQSVKEGAGMAAGSAVLGAPFAALGGVLDKGAEAAKTAEGLQSVAQAAPTGEQVGDQLSSTVKNAVQPQIDDATKALQEAQEKQAGIESVSKSVGEEAPTRQAITSKAQQAAQSAHNDLNTAYEESASKIKGELKGITVPYKDSNLAKAATSILGGEEKGDIKDIFGSPNPVSANLKAKLQRLQKFDEKGEYDFTADKLLDLAKNVKEELRSTGWSTAEDRADRDAYFKMLDAIHNDYYNVAEKAGKPELTDALNNMNSDYKEGIQKFKNPDVKKILHGESEGNILKLVQGTGSVKDIQTIKNTIGKDAYGELVDNTIQRMSADSLNPKTGEFDFNSFFKKMNSIDPAVRGEMLEGTKKGGPIELALSQMKDLNASQVIPNSETTIKDATKMMEDMIGKGNINKLLGNPDKVKALSTMIGPDAMGELGKSVMQNQLREAATTIGKDGKVSVGPVDFNKVMNFVEKFKDQPELVDSFFRPTKESAEAYDQLISHMKNVEGVKNMIKYGVLMPIGVGAGAGLGHFIGHPFWGALVAYWGEKKAGKFLDFVANHPQTWRAIKGLDQVAKKPVAQGVGMLGRYAAGKASASALNQALQGTSTTLGQQ